MICDLFWRIARLFVGFLRFFDRDIVASDLWNIKLVGMSSPQCLLLTDPDIQIQIQASFNFSRYLRAAGCTTGVTMCAHNTYIDNNKPKCKTGDEYPKIRLKLYAPFGSQIGTGFTNITVTVRHKPSGISESKTGETDFTGGISYRTMFVQDILEKLNGRVLTWYHRNT